MGVLPQPLQDVLTLWRRTGEGGGGGGGKRGWTFVLIIQSGRSSLLLHLDGKGRGGRKEGSFPPAGFQDLVEEEGKKRGGPQTVFIPLLKKIIFSAP